MDLRLLNLPKPHSVYKHSISGFGTFWTRHSVERYRTAALESLSFFHHNLWAYTNMLVHWQYSVYIHYARGPEIRDVHTTLSVVPPDDNVYVLILHSLRVVWLNCRPYDPQSTVMWLTAYSHVTHSVEVLHPDILSCGLTRLGEKFLTREEVETARDVLHNHTTAATKNTDWYV